MTASTAHSYTCRVRWSDVDAFGHVNNVKYFEYVQEARIGFMHSLADGTLSGASTWVVARQDVEYKRPMLFRSAPYEIRTVVTRIGRSSYELQADILDGEVLMSRARTVVVAFDQGTQRSRIMTDVERSALESAHVG
ncbi:MAG TPA: thioesterase family protein [Nocardioidaceae bacterium]|nr:thioesterase family protein [Nocardioidaceae bacterium]